MDRPSHARERNADVPDPTPGAADGTSVTSTAQRVRLPSPPPSPEPRLRTLPTFPCFAFAGVLEFPSSSPEPAGCSQAGQPTMWPPRIGAAAPPSPVPQPRGLADTSGSRSGRMDGEEFNRHPIRSYLQMRTFRSLRLHVPTPTFLVSPFSSVLRGSRSNRQSRMR